MRLLSTDDPRVIGGILAEYRKETRAIIDQINEICWYMRGSISREEALILSPEERKSIVKLTDDNIKRVNDTRLPIL
jgi:hypothetical protein